MFSKGSRYRNLSELVFLTAEGERARGKVLRLIPALESTVTHTVKGGDRLDLLSYKYYGDTTKWWQISDANPERPFPVDLLDTTPLAEELFVLSHASFEVRYADLIVALKTSGEVHNYSTTYFQLIEPVTPVALPEVAKPNFVQEKVMVTYPEAKRADVLNAIKAQNFRHLESFSFAKGAEITEIFTIEYPEVKRGWALLVAEMAQTAGVVKVHSSLDEATLALVYNTDVVARESLLSLINLQGFIVDVTPSSRIGRKIRIPPNQVV